MGRDCCGAGVPDVEAGRSAPFVGDRDVYEAAVTSKFDFLADAAVCSRSFGLRCIDDDRAGCTLSLLQLLKRGSV